jgi:hypothetical protein
MDKDGSRCRLIYWAAGNAASTAFLNNFQTASRCMPRMIARAVRNAAAPICPNGGVTACSAMEFQVMETRRL